WRPTLPAPEITTFIADPPEPRSGVLRYRLQQRLQRGLRTGRHHEVDDVALLERAAFDGDEAAASSLDADDRDLAGRLHRGDRPPGRGVGDVDGVVQERAAGERLLLLLLPVEQQELDLRSRPADGRDRRDAEALIDVGPARIVDPGDDLGDVVVLAGDSRRDD